MSNAIEVFILDQLTYLRSVFLIEAVHDSVDPLLVCFLFQKLSIIVWLFMVRFLLVFLNLDV